MTAALFYIPRIEILLARYVAWVAYGYVQGQQMTGIWVRNVHTHDLYRPDRHVFRYWGMSADMGRSLRQIISTTPWGGYCTPLSLHLTSHGSLAIEDIISMQTI
jgi:hypothetical protein